MNAAACMPSETIHMMFTCWFSNCDGSIDGNVLELAHGTMHKMLRVLFIPA